MMLLLIQLQMALGVDVMKFLVFFSEETEITFVRAVKAAA